jgi:hypothetical protein
MREKTECKINGKDDGVDGMVRVCVLTRVGLWLRSYASPPQTCAFVLPSPWPHRHRLHALFSFPLGGCSNNDLPSPPSPPRW